MPSAAGRRMQKGRTKDTSSRALGKPARRVPSPRITFPAIHPAHGWSRKAGSSLGAASNRLGSTSGEGWDWKPPASRLGSELNLGQPAYHGAY